MVIRHRNLAPKILIVSASPHHLNNNNVLNDFVFDGVCELFDEPRVSRSSYGNADFKVLEFRPEIVLVFGSIAPDICEYNTLRDACDKVKALLVFWLHDDPYELDFRRKITGIADYIFTNDEFSAAHYEHKNVAFLPLAGNPSTHTRPWIEQKNNDIFFSGAPFANRVQLISELENFLLDFKCEIIGPGWPQLSGITVDKRIPNFEWCTSCALSSITLNIGREYDIANHDYRISASTPGPRTFEAAFAGTVQLYFSKNYSIVEFFEPDEEIIICDSISEIKEKIYQLVNDKILSRKLAEAARQRALKDHTYAVRCKNLIQSIGYRI